MPCEQHSANGKMTSKSTGILLTSGKGYRPARDGSVPYVAAFKYGSLEGRWRERYSAVCAACFAQNRACSCYQIELPLRCLLTGHNPSDHAFESGYAYSNPTNRLLSLLRGASIGVGADKFVGLMPHDWGFAHQDWLPLHRGLGLSDLGVEPGNDASKYLHATLIQWRDELFASMRGHMRRVGDSLVLLHDKARQQGTSSGSSSSSASSSSAAASVVVASNSEIAATASSSSSSSFRCAITTTAEGQKPQGHSKKRKRTASAGVEVRSKYFPVEAAVIHKEASSSSSSSSSASSSNSSSSSSTAGAGATSATASIVREISAETARRVLDVIARQHGLSLWHQLPTGDLRSAEYCAPRYVAFAGKAEWTKLFEPPLG